MKKILFFFLITKIITCTGQLNSGKITYTIKSIEFEVIDKSTKDSKLIEATKKIANSQIFSLYFNSTKSKFIKESTLNENIDSNTKQKIDLLNKIASLRFTLDFNFYIDFTLKKTIKEKDDGILISENLKNIEWQILNESKKIGDYLVYKATYNKTYIGRDGKNKSSTVVAWFAPSLPYSYGPKEYYGLPGLILELQDKETTFIASNMEFYENEINILFPKGKKISEEDYNKKVMSKN